MPQFPAAIDLSSLDGSNGFKLSGVAANDFAGRSVASGDVNGDGFADLIIGARYADPNGSYSGASYVVFGKAAGFGANIDLSSLDGSNGFKLSGVAADDFSGGSVASAGDVNGDGFDDLIVGARSRRPQRRHQFRRELRGVRQGRRLRAPTSTCRTSTAATASSSAAPRRRLRRLLGRLGRRRQRRRLRRPDRRRPGVDNRTAAVPARATWCSARPQASPPTSTCRASTAATASSSAASQRSTTPAARSPRRATSTATASPT